MREEYNGVEFEVSATSHGVGGTWVGEFTIYAKTSNGDPVTHSQYKMTPGEFANEGDAAEAARKHVKELIDNGLAEGPGDE